MISTFWIVGECSGKMRSTPWPNETFRTVNDARVPPRCRPMTTPSKIWMRSLSPSRTLTCTRTVSPDLIAGRSVSCAFSTSSIALIGTPQQVYRPALRFFLPRDEIAQHLPLFVVEIRPSQQIRPPLERPRHRFALPPPADIRMVARQQHIRDRHVGRALWPRPRQGRGTGVLRKVEQPAAERILR